jgi:hypothetical protein
MTLSEQVHQLETALESEKAEHEKTKQRIVQVYAQFAGWLGCLPKYEAVRDAIKTRTGN